MKLIIKRDVRKLIGPSLGLLVIIYILFSIVERQAASTSYEVFVLRMLTDHYLLIYCMTPIFLLSIFRNLEEDTPFLIIRFQRFSHYFYAKWLALSVFAVLFVLLQIITVLIMGIGLPLGNIYPPDGNELITHFGLFFSTPVEAIVATSIYMMAGLGFVGISILTIFHFFSRKWVTILILIAYGVMALSIKIPLLGSLPLLTINRYIILHHNFLLENGILWTIAAMIILVIIQIVLIRFAWFRSFSISYNIKLKGLFSYYARALWTRQNILLLLGILGILTYWKSMSAVDESVQDYMIRFFYGTEINSFHLITFLEQIIYYGTPLYLFAIFLENLGANDNMHVYIRMRRKKTWAYSIVLNGIIFNIIYVLLTFVLLFTVGLLTNKSGVTHTIPFSEHIAPNIWTAFMGLKMLELSVLFLLFFFLFIWMRTVTMAYLVVMALHGLSLIPFLYSAYNPAGLVTIAKLQLLDGSGGISLTHVLTVLMIAFTLLLGLIFRSYKRYFN